MLAHQPDDAMNQPNAPAVPANAQAVPTHPQALSKRTPALVIALAAVSLSGAVILAVILGSLLGANRVYVSGGSQAKVSDGHWAYATLQIGPNDEVTIFESELTTQLTPPPGEPKALLRAQVYTGDNQTFLPQRNLPDGGQATTIRNRNTLAFTLNRLDRQGWEVVVELPSSQGTRLLLRRPR